MHLLFRWLLNTLALFVVVNVVPHIHYRSLVTLAIAALVLGLLNALVRPILFFLTLPLTVITLGLFVLILNALVLELVSFFVHGFTIDSFGWAVVGALVLSLVSMITNRIGGSDRRR